MGGRQTRKQGMLCDGHRDTGLHRHDENTWEVQLPQTRGSRNMTRSVMNWTLGVYEKGRATVLPSVWRDTWVLECLQGGREHCRRRTGEKSSFVLKLNKVALGPYIIYPPCFLYAVLGEPQI